MRLVLWWVWWWVKKVHILSVIDDLECFFFSVLIITNVFIDLLRDPTR